MAKITQWARRGTWEFHVARGTRQGATRAKMHARSLAILSLFCAVFGATQYKFAVNMEGKKGEFVVEVNDDWAPLGAARFHELAATPGFFDGVRFFRTVKGFMTQFGIPGKPAVAAEWKDKKIDDDPVKECV